MFSLPPVTQALIVANCAIFFIDSLSRGSFAMAFALWPIGPQFLPWQLLTYAFLHGGLSHLAFNMFGLWMFGAGLEFSRIAIAALASNTNRVPSGRRLQSIPK